MCPLLFQETQYLETITIGFYWNSFSFPLPLLSSFPYLSQRVYGVFMTMIHITITHSFTLITFPFYPTSSGFWVFIYTDHNHTSVTLSHSYTFIPLSHRVWVLCIGLSFIHTYLLCFFHYHIHFYFTSVSHRVHWMFHRVLVHDLHHVSFSPSHSHMSFFLPYVTYCPNHHDAKESNLS
jgi:hypothetical protein